jgi:hypothetical protein
MYMYARLEVHFASQWGYALRLDVDAANKNMRAQQYGLL